MTMPRSLLVHGRRLPPQDGVPERGRGPAALGGVQRQPHRDGRQHDQHPTAQHLPHDCVFYQPERAGISFNTGATPGR